MKIPDRPQMNSEHYNSRQLIDYLLGSLSTSETERLDELSVVDGDLAQSLRVAENDLLDAYLNGELDDNDRGNFEAHYMASPLRREKFAFAKALQEHGGKLLATGSVRAEKSKEGAFSFADLFVSFSPALRLGFAAALLLLVLCAATIFIFRWSGRPDDITARNKAVPPYAAVDPANTSAAGNHLNAPVNDTLSGAVPPGDVPDTNRTNRHDGIHADNKKNINSDDNKRPVRSKDNQVFFALAPSLRSGSLPSLSIPGGTVDIVLRLELESGDHVTYQAVLNDETEKTVWRGGNIKARGNAITIRVPARLIGSQIYSVALSGINTSGEAELITNYNFRARRVE